VVSFLLEEHTFGLDAEGEKASKHEKEILEQELSVQIQLALRWQLV
jgi:hypothetical protein